MPSRFGGQIEASGVLGQLWESDQRAREQITQQASQRAGAEQNALDQDAQDKWNNGQMSDADWLAYIRSRVVGTAGFPTEHVQWTKLLRETTDNIGVNQAEFAYQNGGSINQLIAFYRQRTAGMKSSSSGWRDSQKRLSDLEDKRLDIQITEGAQAIQDRIDNGQATPTDLLAYMKAQLGKARTGSEMDTKIRQDITALAKSVKSFQQQADISKLQYDWQAGKLTGNEYAAKLRAAAPQFAAEPKTYYNMLAEADDASKSYGQFVYEGSGGPGGSGGSAPSGTGGGQTPGGSGGFTRTRPPGDRTPRSFSDLQSQWDDVRNRGLDISQQVLSGKTTVTDPGTQRTVDVSTDAGKRWLANVQRDVVNSYHTERYWGGILGNKTMVNNAEDNAAKYIATVAQPTNSITNREATGMMLSAIGKAITSSNSTLDPADTITRMQGLAFNIKTLMDHQARGSTSIFGMGLPTGAPKSAVESGVPEDTIALTALYGVLNAKTPDEVQAAFDKGVASIDPKTTGIITPDFLNEVAFGGKQWGGMTGTLNIQEGLNSVPPTMTYFSLPGKEVTVVPVVFTQQQSPTGELIDVPQPQLNADQQKAVKQISDQGGSPITFAQQVGWKVVKVQGYVTQEPVGVKGWVAQVAINHSEVNLKIDKGQLLTDSNIAALKGLGEWDGIQASRQVKLDDAGYVPTLRVREPGASSDTLWTKLPGGSWVKGLYPAKWSTSPDGGVHIDDNHNPVLVKGIAVADVPVPFMGNNGKLMQDALNSGQFESEIAGVSGVEWNTMAGGTSKAWDQSYYSKADALQKTAWDASRRSAQDHERGWWHEGSRRVSESANYNAQKRLEFESQQGAASQYEDGGLGSFAKSLGIDIPGMTASKPAAAPKPASWPTQQMPTMQPETSGLPRIGGPTNIDLPHPQAGSGLAFTRSLPPPPDPTPQTPVSDGSFLSGLSRMMNIDFLRSRATTPAPTPTPPPPPPPTFTRSGKKIL